MITDTYNIDSAANEINTKYPAYILVKMNFWQQMESSIQVLVLPVFSINNCYEIIDYWAKDGCHNEIQCIWFWNIENKWMIRIMDKVNIILKLNENIE